MQIDHDPKDRRDIRPEILGYAAIATPLYVWTHGWPAHGWPDHLALFLFLCLLWWLLSPGVRREAGHDGPRQGFAFRLGQLLKGVLRPLRR